MPVKNSRNRSKRYSRNRLRKKSSRRRSSRRRTFKKRNRKYGGAGVSLAKRLHKTGKNLHEYDKWLKSFHLPSLDKGSRNRATHSVPVSKPFKPFKPLKPFKPNKIENPQLTDDARRRYEEALTPSFNYYSDIFGGNRQRSGADTPGPLYRGGGRRRRRREIRRE